MRALPAFCVMLAACAGDETLTAYGAGDRTWVLKEIDGNPFDAKASLRFFSKGRFEGEAPCNGFSGEIEVPYPWFDASNMTSTKKTCTQQKAEEAFCTAFRAMTFAETAEDTLLLSAEGGRSMVFTLDAAAPR